MGDKIRVLSVCTSDSSGGAARAAYRIHLAVRKCGIDSRMFVKNKGTADENVLPVSDFLPHNALYRTFDLVRNKVKNKWQHYQWGKYPNKGPYFMSDLRSTDISEALQKIDYDVLHLHWVNLRFLPLDKLPKDKPIVWTLHDSWPFCGVCHVPMDCHRYETGCGCCPQLGSDDLQDLSHRVWLKKQKLYNDLNLHIVTPSNWLAECARGSALFKGYDIRVIPNCLDVNVFRPLSESEISPRWKALQAEKKRYLIFGAMNAVKDRNKGFSFLLSALKKIEDSMSDVELLVFGANESDLQMDVKMRVHYLGFIGKAEELVSLYNLSSAAVVPSMSEVFGQTASEALACGTPVVAFRCTGIQDVVDHQVNGYLADPYDPMDLADGILWCLENNSDDRLSHNARQKVLDRYSPALVGEQFSRLYNELVNHHGEASRVGEVNGY
ncbi:MAG: glycosyltransferase [Bacteroidales bacterium]|nr:glycosyltransferase [Bacteroidales bacterium]